MSDIDTFTSYMSLYFLSMYDLCTCDFLLVVVIVAGGEQMAEDHCGHEHIVLLVFHNWDTPPVVPHSNLIVLPGRHIQTFVLYLYTKESRIDQLYNIYSILQNSGSTLSN